MGTIIDREKLLPYLVGTGTLGWIDYVIFSNFEMFQSMSEKQDQLPGLLLSTLLLTFGHYTLLQHILKDVESTFKKITDQTKHKEDLLPKPSDCAEGMPRILLHDSQTELKIGASIVLAANESNAKEHWSISASWENQNRISLSIQHGINCVNPQIELRPSNAPNPLYCTLRVNHIALDEQTAIYFDAKNQKLVLISEAGQTELLTIVQPVY